MYIGYILRSTLILIKVSEILASDSLDKMYNGFDIVLSNGFGYNLIYTEEAKSWIEKLARIMELKKSYKIDNKYKKIIIFRMGKNKTNFSDRIKSLLDEETIFPCSGWVIENFISLQYFSHKSVKYMICDIGEEANNNLEFIRMQSFLKPIYKQAILNGGLPIHAGLIEKEGKSVILGASSGIGKSTCCSRIKYPWNAICDDLIVVLLDNKIYKTHPFPTWSNYIWGRSKRTWNVQKSLFLSAIFLLEQSTEDKIILLKPGEAALKITNLAAQIYSSYWEYTTEEEKKELKTKIFSNAWDLTTTIPSYTLRCSLHGEFWKEIEKVV